MAYFRAREENPGKDKLNDRPDEIVFVSFGNADVVDGTHLRFEAIGHVVDEDVSVDVLRLALEAALK